MKKIAMFKNLLPAVVSIILFAGTIANAQQIDGKGPRALAAPTTSTQNVKVVNTTAEPVPVAVTGTPTVQVANSSANPVQIRDADNPARQPFQATLNVSFLANDPGSEPQNSLAVPLGKRLVIKYLSVYIDIPPDQYVAGDLAIIVNNGNQALPISWFVLNRQVGVAGQDSIFTAAQPVELYVEPGTEFWAEFFRNSSTGSGFGRVVVSGYLVNIIAGT